MNKMMNKGLYSSNTEEYETPQDFFDELDKEFHFKLDVCATDENHKCKKYYTKKEDGLSQYWGFDTWKWCNPPYGREISKWVAEASKYNKVVMLLPARTDTKYFHEYIYNKKDVEIRFIKGRLKFGGLKNSAPFPSMVVIFR